MVLNHISVYGSLNDDFDKEKTNSVRRESSRCRSSFFFSVVLHIDEILIDETLLVVVRGVCCPF
jgi:preprotein translocase subunit SecA